MTMGVRGLLLMTPQEVVVDIWKYPVTIIGMCIFVTAPLFILQGVEQGLLVKM